MKLEAIQDIEVLRSELKYNMTKCMKSFKYDNKQFNEGEYYYLDFSDYNDNYGDIWIADSQSNEDKCAFIDRNDDNIVKECFGINLWK